MPLSPPTELESGPHSCFLSCLFLAIRGESLPLLLSSFLLPLLGGRFALLFFSGRGKRRDRCPVSRPLGATGAKEEKKREEEGRGKSG